MSHRTAQEIAHQNRGDMFPAVSKRSADPLGSTAAYRNLDTTSDHRDDSRCLRDWLAHIPILPQFGKMVVSAIKRSGLMTKHQIEHICWREVSWQRPFEIEDVWQALTHLSALSPRGAIIWECWGENGQITHLLGADQTHIRKIEGVLCAHGNIQFREVSGNSRTSIQAARQLRITKPVLSLNTNLAEAVIRAGLAAMTEDKHGEATVLQIVLGRATTPPRSPPTSPTRTLPGWK